MKEKLLEIKKIFETDLDINLTDSKEEIDGKYKCIRLLDELISMSQEMGLYEESEGRCL